jgi:hypothetical protein
LKLSDRTLDKLAKMVVGDEKHFPYRSSKYITLFFERCGRFVVRRDWYLADREASKDRR